MKKIILGVLLSCPLLFATSMENLEQKASHGDALSAYELAALYEQKNDKERSFLWYKKAASLALDAKQKNASLESSILGDKIQKTQRTQEVYGRLLESYPDEETSHSVYQMLTKTFDILPYKINYLLPVTYDDAAHQNRDHQETKFQLSFQKSLMDNFLGLNETLWAGYTQTSWWQTSATSAPFRETNYQPELFMMMPHFDQNSALNAYKIGLLHESNGQSFDRSRSWNRLYAKAFFQYEGLVMAPRIWYRIPEKSQDDDNPTIENYLGYGDLELIYPWKKQTFKLLVKNNFHFDRTNRGAVQFDWTFPLWEQNLFGYFQLYSGYAESLIDYDKRSDRIGIGFAFSR